MIRAGAALVLVTACGSAGGERGVVTASTGATATPRASASPVTPPPASASAVAAPEPAPPRPPRIEGPAFVEIEVEGWGPAVVAVPVGAPSPQPVVLATHGNYDHPEWQCSTWRGIVGPERFILCPRGIPRPDSPSPDDVRFTHASNAALEAEIEAGLEALRRRFAGQVADGAIVYTGFSLGAIMGVAIAARARHPGRYPAMVLVEGGHDRWTPATAKAFAGAGGRRVLFACGQPSCFLDAARASTHLERAGVTTKVVGVKDAGHSYGGAVARELQAAWTFVAPDPPPPGAAAP